MTHHTSKDIDAQSINTVVSSRSVQMAKNKSQIVQTMPMADFTSPTERFRRHLQLKNNEITNKIMTSPQPAIFGEVTDA